MDRIKSLTQPNKSDILFLQGVFKKDCLRDEDIFRNKLMMSVSSSVETVYDKIPSHFTTLDRWLKSTNLLCRWCHRAIKGRPWFKPISIEPLIQQSAGELSSIEMHAHQPTHSQTHAQTSTPTHSQTHAQTSTPTHSQTHPPQLKQKKLLIGVRGVHCSRNCVCAEITHTANDLSELQNSLDMLKIVDEIFSGPNAAREIQPSPDPTCMLQYGGDVTVAEYQKIIDNLDHAYLRELDDNNISTIYNLHLKKSDL